MSITAKVNPIEGIYKLRGKKLIPEAPSASHYFIIGQRVSKTLKRASNYLVLFYGESKKYFSSLYPLERHDDVYEAEHDGVLYRVEMSSDSAIIKKAGYVR